MKNTTAFAALEAMMLNGSLILTVSELEDSLKFLEEMSLITAREREALLELAKKLRAKNQPADTVPTQNSPAA